MHRTVIAACFVAAVFTVSTVTPAAQGAAQGQAQGQSQAKPDPKPEPKPEAKKDDKAAAASLAGKWDVSVETPNGPVTSTLEMKIDGKKVAGKIASQMGEAVIEGELAEGKLTFWFTMDANGQSLSVTFVGASQKDGSLSGTFNFGQGDMPWTATKAKN